MLPDGLKEFGIGKRAADKRVFIRVAEVCKDFICALDMGLANFETGAERMLQR